MNSYSLNKEELSITHILPDFNDNDSIAIELTNFISRSSAVDDKEAAKEVYDWWAKKLDECKGTVSFQDPDPAKLEKYAALKKAYEHYSLMLKLADDGDFDAGH